METIQSQVTKSKKGVQIMVGPWEVLLLVRRRNVKFRLEISWPGRHIQPEADQKPIGSYETETEAHAAAFEIAQVLALGITFSMLRSNSRPVEKESAISLLGLSGAMTVAVFRHLGLPDDMGRYELDAATRG